MREKKFKCWQIYWKRKSSIHKMASNGHSSSQWKQITWYVCAHTAHTQHPNDKMRNSFIHISPALALALSVLSVTFDFNSEIYLFIWLTEFAHSDTRSVFMFVSLNLFRKFIQETSWMCMSQPRMPFNSIGSSGNRFLFLGDDDDDDDEATAAAAVISSNVVCLLLFICSEGNVDFSMIWKIYSDELWAIACVRTLVLSLICIHFGLYRASSLLYYYYDCCLVLLIHRFQ